MKKIILLIIGVVFSISLTTGIAIAEITRDKSAIEGVDYKIFVFGQNPDSILSRTNADYEINGYPSTQIFIRNWDKLTILEKASITNELNAMGYFESVG